MTRTQLEFGRLRRECSPLHTLQALDIDPFFEAEYTTDRVPLLIPRQRWARVAGQRHRFRNDVCSGQPVSSG